MIDTILIAPGTRVPLDHVTAGNLTSGTVVCDAGANLFLSLGARHDWLEVAPVVNGKSIVSCETTFKFCITPGREDAYPERRHDPVFDTGLRMEDIRRLALEAGKIADGPQRVSIFLSKFILKTGEQKAAVLETLRDLIETKREMKQSHQQYTDSLGAAMGFLSSLGTVSTAEALHSHPVEGHPENCQYQLARNLVPFYVRDRGDAERALEKAQAIYDAAARQYYAGAHAASMAKTGPERAKAKKTLTHLASNFVTLEALEAIRTETLPELQRLYKEAALRFPMLEIEPKDDCSPARTSKNQLDANPDVAPTAITIPDRTVTAGGIKCT